jgi:hypothetical protein
MLAMNQSRSGIPAPLRDSVRLASCRDAVGRFII